MAVLHSWWVVLVPPWTLSPVGPSPAFAPSSFVSDLYCNCVLLHLYCTCVVFLLYFRWSRIWYLCRNYVSTVFVLIASFGSLPCPLLGQEKRRWTDQRYWPLRWRLFLCRIYIVFTVYLYRIIICISLYLYLKRGWRSWRWTDQWWWSPRWRLFLMLYLQCISVVFSFIMYWCLFRVDWPVQGWWRLFFWRFHHFPLDLLHHLQLTDLKCTVLCL